MDCISESVGKCGIMWETRRRIHCYACTMTVFSVGRFMSMGCKTMDSKVDWYAFSIDLGQTIPGHGWRWGDIVVALSEQIHIPFGEWIEGRGRAPYNHSAQLANRGIYVGWSGKFTHCHVEFTGVGCDWLRRRGMLNEVLTMHAHRTTRIDIASDFETEVRPHVFAEQRSEKRAQSHASYHTKSGETEYIGSRTSELMARVYRYSSPHPRAHLLRVEHECKRKTAKAGVRYLLENGVESFQRSLGARFGWSHPLWSRTDTPLLTFSNPSQTREEAKTDIWLRTQCAAAFRKLVLSGAIKDPEAYLKEVFGNETLSQ